jgi:uncharacterized protein
LVHISELSNRYVKEPSDVVKVGQIVQVHVLTADAKTKRIALSMKTPSAKTPSAAAGAPQTKASGAAAPPAGARPQAKKFSPPPKPQKPPPTMDDKLAALADRWKRR